MKVLIRGAGVAGLTLAHELATRGADVTVIEQRGEIAGNASWQAGGMLAPWCERESAEEAVLKLGRGAADWWDAALPGHVSRGGTLVLAPARDIGELDRFGRRTSGFRKLGAGEIAAFEPALAGRFGRGLFFADEAHLDPRKALHALGDKLLGMGARLEFHGSTASAIPDIEVDCTGIAARRPELRGVRGEMLMLRTADISLARTVRLLHPRIPIYVVPRSENLFMVGATMVESDAAGPITARSAMELLSAAYALHPAFGEAELVEAGVGVRPAFADNLPRVDRDGKNLRINGLYRHGFLLAPAMARQAADLILGNPAAKEFALEAHR
ncbi:FAD-dependent oxidoreductase [Mesorhizobium sp. M2D.F.Ca.ET.185.01.1.1]|uniref:FAD-dependent oxidoreductase n=1 Tax=unclassified Mesorhizobium TaxID=325217 RepID=UPI000FCC9D62|nr:MULTISPECIES: FAD-dependent oxidoreductase [unclassified Mesorhizobium]TGP77356.1 FAD-dependent oxidoreductase [bacterium M00.F.Ca.ET.227.01.1.1]TGP93150.1 FAD-dependent oxidoreductase [bacterium M00.F.Ca.ET.222.01.1.1]TGP96696.1 FAD-dependent oxidoreductase [bacterium M00.F.Ca.ET.221.01.1.1]TGT95030.1 FAD-dependent oxidoreductase [bacterium M00.F.Ca.ET.163.01.1.1]TGU18465.1 FAD-dependent oxidoreductase [bacterium M00.F.Ca.ET.156.01.1.1]TGU49908.1 FAD-dependent oxidoreductase [bacterium M0